MEYPNSYLVDPSSYDTTMDGLCTNIPLRVHRNASLADRGALRAQKDWQRAFGSLRQGFAGTMGPEHNLNLASTSLPETLPDRLELMGYIVEVMCLVDDMMDAVESPTAAIGPYMVDLLHAYNVVMGGGEMDGSSCSPVAGMVIDVGRQMFAVDAERARVACRWAEKWAKLMLSTFGSEKEPRDFDEYLEHRRTNVSSQATFGLSIFAMGLSIPEDQQQTCLDLSEPMWITSCLANDCHSWEREHQAAADNNHDSVSNAIWVLMNRHSMTCDEAKAECRQRATQYAAEYLRVVDAAKARDDLCQDAKFLLDVLRFAISGHVVWGLQCLRYHPDKTLSPKQLEMAKAVGSDLTTGWCHRNQNATDAIAEHPKVETIGAVTNGTNSTPGSGLTAVREVPKLGLEALEAPSRYLDSLPAKGIRNKTIDALNIWFKVPQTTASAIKWAINLLHGCSLMIDDIQDSSQLRRGKPATHIVFGTVQTINSAGYRFLSALNEVVKLDSERCMGIFCEEVQSLYIGQSHDVSWTSNLVCPTEDEYMAMVDGKTAGLFRMLARLLDAKSDSPNKPDITLLTRFMTLLGRLFQIRDDYMNLTSDDYTKQKGFCEDLDEGKYSLPVIHALRACDASETAAHSTAILRNLLSQRHLAGRMSLDQKKLFLEHLRTRGSLEYTQQAMGELQTELKRMAEQMGMLDNKSLKELLKELKV